ncbi:MAG TPA: hypothetical protein VGJ55_15175 [Pyrinomonadaceae bacterium]|jgi:hypothetical protein
MCRNLILIVASFLWLAPCGLQPKPDYVIDKKSPKGTYRVKVRLWEEKPSGSGDYTEHIKVQYFKGEEIIGTYENKNSDQYEDSFREGMQVVEWLDDNVLRMGRDRSMQPYNDELIVTNNTQENVKQFSVLYGKFEQLHLFDLPPRSQVTLYASPEFKPDHSSNYFLGYGGSTKSGRTFEGALQSKQRTSPSDGPLRFHIMIEEKDLR